VRRVERCGELAGAVPGAWHNIACHTDVAKGFHELRKQLAFQLTVATFILRHANELAAPCLVGFDHFPMFRTNVEKL